MSSPKNSLPWLSMSYLLAQHLIQQQVHKRYLTLMEQKYIQDATCSLATWIAFINTHDNTSIELDTCAFRVRSMLYEQLIPHLFHSQKPCCKVLDIEPLLEQARQLTMPSLDEISREWQNFMENHVKKQTSPQPQHDSTHTPDMNAMETKQKPNSMEDQGRLF